MSITIENMGDYDEAADVEWWSVEWANYHPGGNPRRSAEPEWCAAGASQWARAPEHLRFRRRTTERDGTRHPEHLEPMRSYQDHGLRGRGPGYRIEDADLALWALGQLAKYNPDHEWRLVKRRRVETVKVTSRVER